MSIVSDLVVKLSADDQTGPAITSLEGRLGKVGTVLKGVFAGAAAGAAIGFLGDAAKAAADDEASVLRLQQAVENSGASWAGYAGQIQGAISKGQSLAFSDDATRESLGQLTTATGDVQKALDLQNLAMDIARGKNVDLGTATDIVQKATLGQFGALKKMGIVLPENATATEALGILQEKYAGQADKYGSSAAGSIVKVKDSISEWKESIGAATGPAMGLIGMLPELSHNMTLAGSVVGGLSTVIRGTMIPSLIAMALPFAPLLLALAAIAAAVALFGFAWTNNLGDIQGKVQAVFGFITGAFDAFKTEGLGGLLKYLGTFAVDMITKFQEIGKGIVSGILDGLGNLKTELWNALVNAISGVHIDFGPFHLSSAGFSIDAPSFPDIHFPGLAAGGIVTQPTLAWIGERGPEAVVPLSSWGTPHRGEMINPAAA